MATNQESIFPELEDFGIKRDSSTLTSEDFMITSDASKSIFPEESDYIGSFWKKKVYNKQRKRN